MDETAELTANMKTEIELCTKLKILTKERQDKITRFERIDRDVRSYGRRKGKGNINLKRIY